MARLSIALLLFVAAAHASAPSPPSVTGKSWMVGDLSSGRVLAAEKPAERVEPASLTKLMTAYVVFAALRERKLSLEQVIEVSERAMRVPGSRMYLEPGRQVTVEQLIRGVVVQSANDACIVLAEAVAGSEVAFVRMMNREAARLGMEDTQFMNASGLPDPRQYSTAQGLYTLAEALIRDFPAEYARYYAQKEFRYNNVNHANRNRLLWLDPSVDGVKTGHTGAAGYCLIASSRRGGRRLLSVLIGATSESARVQESQKLLNWGFQFFDSVKLFSAGDPVRTLEVWKGAAGAVKVGVASDLLVTVPRGEADKLRAELVSQQPLIAPLASGQRVGVVRVSFEGKPYGEAPLIALEPVGEAGLLGRAWDTLRLWTK
ncbi:MAG TPA: D-alanyl-D-alanine carboxypeptidase family protein [Burkholderiales bacterium]|nr:D-alanyl-D-alanine carboxypeptidase family protein [Burkholderiales bacterium]